MAEVVSSVCGWNTALEESISDKSHRLREARRRSKLARPWWQRKGHAGTGTGTGTASEMQSWENQARVIGNDIIKWRRRKAKANLVCKMLTEGASKAAKLLKAIQDVELYLAELWHRAPPILWMRS
ncbi:hypothetical protein CTA1_9846 [Colletotrichum tanaceti]|uniref:Uncharacterized protein n=1 Tax=Colletotrichum tanaceti TaxID=1306861 RepID=A0A4U6XF78_9PEZI|nr:hypothetical protein CTA1_9846 [Colletotrichum tanaceti]